MPNRVDREEAFAAYVEMGADRSYVRVAARFGVVKKTVTDWAVKDKWQDRLRSIEQRAAAKTEDRLVRARTERIADTLKVIDAARSRFAGQLRIADFRLTGSDFVGLIKLEQLLEGEATARIEIAEIAPILESYGRAVIELAEIARVTDPGRVDGELRRLDETLARLAAAAAGAIAPDVAAA